LITFLSEDKNRGFSAGNNLAIRLALNPDTRNAAEPFDALLLLNSDTIVHAGALSALTNALARDERIGLVGPRLEWPGGELQPSCFRYISPLSELLSAAKTGPLSRLLSSKEVLLERPEGDDAVEWISFACVLIRREVFESVGLLDENYFMYYEDVDYSRRAREHGWKIAWETGARVTHLRGGTTPETFAAKERRRKPRYYYASRARYLSKFYGRGGPCVAHLLWLAGRSISLVREVGGRKAPHTADREPIDIWTDCFQGARNAANGRHASRAMQETNRRNPDDQHVP
jgi:GT2 family glycosyltransferase